MKHFFKLTILASVVTALIFGLSAFTSVKKANVDSYQIVLVDKSTDGTNETWTWTLTNPNPGSGDNGTLQDVSHWSIQISPSGEAALVSAEYSRDGVNWTSITTSVDRDPTIKLCTSSDVLKFDVGTSGSEPTYYRITMSETFEVNPYATSWIKTGSGRQGCNTFYFSGIGTVKLD
jgi:hypothetical protein